MNKIIWWVRIVLGCTMVLSGPLIEASVPVFHNATLIVVGVIAIFGGLYLVIRTSKAKINNDTIKEKKL